MIAKVKHKTQNRYTCHTLSLSLNPKSPSSASPAMALHPHRLRRALSFSLSVLRTSRQGLRPISSGLLSAPRPTHIPTLSSVQTSTRFFTSTTSLLRNTFDSETDEIRPDTILFEGCDYNHWLITIDFPKDANLTREQMIDTYVNTAAQVFGR